MSVLNHNDSIARMKRRIILAATVICLAAIICYLFGGSLWTPYRVGMSFEEANAVARGGLEKINYGIEYSGKPDDAELVSQPSFWSIDKTRGVHLQFNHEGQVLSFQRYKFGFVNLWAIKQRLGL